MFWSAKEKRWSMMLILFILILGGIIFFELQEFMSGFLGAFTLYVLMRKQMIYLTERKKFRPSSASALLLVEVVLLFLIPISVVSIMLADKISMIDIDFQFILGKLNELAYIVEQKTGYEIFTGENLSFIPKWGIATVQGVAQSIYSLVINSLVMIFVLYFLFIKGKKIERAFRDLMPLKENNKTAVLQEVKVMIHANAIGIPLLAVAQGGVALAGFLIFDVKEPLFYAILTGFATIIPLLGTGLVWAPLGISMIMNDNLVNGIGLLLFGFLVITNIDNLIRFLLQKKLANVHPLITVFGVIAGLKLFGFWGVIFGPLLVSLFYLCINIYRQEYTPRSESLND
jgi:predicted PurR-regulated permease PerM